MTTQQPAQGRANGHSDEFPVESYRDAARHLRRPFTAEAVKFKPQSQTKSGKTLCVAYIDARLAIERLNLVVPDRWSDTFESVGGGLMWCHLTIDGITRSDVGEGKGKALVSDALKRAAVHFGVGVSLYAIPSMLLSGRVEFMYPDSTEYGELRKRYRAWLDANGREAFGEPLDHGDVETAVGDPDGTASVELGENGGNGEVASPQKKELTPEKRLEVLLGKGGSLQAKRRQVDEAMVAMGAGVTQRLRELENSPDGRSLDALLTRVQNANGGGS